MAAKKKTSEANESVVLSVQGVSLDASVEEVSIQQVEQTEEVVEPQTSRPVEPQAPLPTDEFFKNLRQENGCFVYDSEQPLLNGQTYQLIYSKGDVIRRMQLREELAVSYNVLLPQETIDQYLGNT